MGSLFAQNLSFSEFPLSTEYAKGGKSNGYLGVGETVYQPTLVTRPVVQLPSPVQIWADHLLRAFPPGVDPADPTGDGGFSVGHPSITAGTIATACYDALPFPGIPQRYYILSNNHVLAASNAANINDPIIQPGTADGGTVAADVIGRLAAFIPIQFHTPTTKPLNFVDAAIAEVPFHLASREIYWIGHLAVVRQSAAAAQGRRHPPEDWPHDQFLHRRGHRSQRDGGRQLWRR